MRTHHRSSVAATALALATLLAACSGGSGSGSDGAADASMAASTEVATPPTLVRSTVFEQGEGGAEVYRIPSIGVTSEHTLVVAAEQRTVSASDVDPHGLVVRTSGDGGATWGGIVELASADEETGCYPSDPAVVAPTEGEAGGEVIIVFRPCREGGGLASVRSADEGETWSEPEPIELERNDRITAEQADVLRAGPGHGVQLADGTLALVADTNMGAATPKVLTLLLSDDGGATWRAGATYEVPEGERSPDESALAVAADGTIVITARGAAPDRLQLAASPDGEELLAVGGQAVATTTGIASTEVQGAMLSLPDGRIVLTTLSDLNVRRGLRMHTLGEGTAWTPGPLIHAGPAAYSDLAMYDETTIVVAAETGERHPYERIEVIPFGVDAVDGEADELPPPAAPPTYAQGRLIVDDVRYEITGFCIADDVMELDGGVLQIDLSQGLEAVGVDATLDRGPDGDPLAFTGTIPVSLTDGILYRGPITDASGTEREIDLVLGYGIAC